MLGEKETQEHSWPLAGREERWSSRREKVVQWRVQSMTRKVARGKRCMNARAPQVMHTSHTRIHARMRARAHTHTHTHTHTNTQTQIPLAKRLAAQIDDASGGLLSLFQSIMVWSQGSNQLKGGGWWGVEDGRLWGYFGSIFSRQSLQGGREVWGEGGEDEGGLSVSSESEKNSRRFFRKTSR